MSAIVFMLVAHSVSLVLVVSFGIYCMMSFDRDIQKHEQGIVTLLRIINSIMDAMDKHDERFHGIADADENRSTP